MALASKFDMVFEAMTGPYAAIVFLFGIWLVSRIATIAWIVIFPAWALIEICGWKRGLFIYGLVVLLAYRLSLTLPLAVF